ncbi:MAG: septation ring formation regulator EzrA [Bacilli bacterium]|nr:septation ring formation regulator EzrA [Bacilli bacterium]
MSTGILVLIIILSILVAAAATFVIILIIKRNYLKHTILDLDRRFQYLHALLIGQDAQYVKRLEIISRTNLLYVDTHTKFVKRFKEIRDHLDANAQRRVNDIKDLYYDHKIKLVKQELPKVLKTVEDYEKEVNILNNDLLKVIKPEENCRQSSLSLKEQLRRVRQDYYAKQSDLTLVNDSFVEVFKYVDSLFEDFEAYVEAAQYDEANAVLPKIDEIIKELAKILVTIPDLCTLVTTIVPEKLISLENAYQTMTEDKYPLHHLCVKQSISEIKKEVDLLTKRIKHFDLEGVRTKLDDISYQIDEYFKLFEEEKAARVDFEQNNENVYYTVGTIEKSFIKLCNTIPEVSKVFVISEEQHNKINFIQSEINRVGALKRTLDTFIHSATKQPYSLLLKKMNELKSSSESIISEIEDFNQYIVSLKEDSENAYNLVFEFFTKIVEAEKRVDQINIQSVTEKYRVPFDHMYELLNSVYKCLIVQPINVEQVNREVGEIKELGNSILDDGQVKQDHNMMVLAENAIVYANSDRFHLSDINELVKHAEEYFRAGEFENAYTTVGDALKRVHANEKR